MKKLLFSLTLFILPALYAQPVPQPDLELVESVPVGTVLGNSEIRSAHDVWVRNDRARTTLHRHRRVLYFE